MVAPLHTNAMNCNLINNTATILMSPIVLGIIKLIAPWNISRKLQTINLKLNIQLSSFAIRCEIVLK